MRTSITTLSPESTERLGERLGHRLRAGDIIVLCGDLGAGKTTLVRGLARGLGADGARVRSPSFTLVNLYEGRNPLYHLDLYRVQGETALASLGWEEYFGGTEAHPPAGPGVTAVEWGERAETLLPADDVLTLRFATDTENSDARSIAGEARGDRMAAIWEEVVRESLTNEMIYPLPPEEGEG